MINKCFITKITSPMENDSEEYLYGVKFSFDGYADGNIGISVNRAVDIASEIYLICFARSLAVLCLKLIDLIEYSPSVWSSPCSQTPFSFRSCQSLNVWKKLSYAFSTSPGPVSNVVSTPKGFAIRHFL